MFAKTQWHKMHRFLRMKKSAVGGSPVSLKAPKCVVRKHDPEYITFCFIMAGGDAELSWMWWNPVLSPFFVTLFFFFKGYKRWRIPALICNGVDRWHCYFLLKDKGTVLPSMLLCFVYVNLFLSSAPGQSICGQVPLSFRHKIAL